MGKKPVDERARLVKAYVRDSTVKSQAGCRALAETLATLVLVQRCMLAERLAGKLSSDQARTLPAMASNIRRISESLGLSTPTESDDEPLL